MVPKQRVKSEVHGAAMLSNVAKTVETPGIEPGASYMQSMRSTTELRPLIDEFGNLTVGLKF